MHLPIQDIAIGKTQFTGTKACKKAWGNGRWWHWPSGPSCRRPGFDMCKRVLIQWSFLVPLIGSRYHILPELAVYTTYISLIYILPIGWLYITYHLLREPETAIDWCLGILKPTLRCWRYMTFKTGNNLTSMISIQKTHTMGRTAYLPSWFFPQTVW